jgi:antitoxin component YwqK of YwqJK toxin-antitoxin module
MHSILPSTVRRLGRLAVLLVGLGALATAPAQVTTATVDLLGPVATISDFREYPDTTERSMFQTMAYRPDGTALERVFFSYSFMDGSLRSRNVTTYDEAGNRLAAVTMDPDGNPLAQTVFRYDDQGNLLEEASYDAAGTETRRVTYERNADGDVVVWEVYVAGALDERNEVDYNAQGQQVEEREYEDGQLTALTTYPEPGRVSETVSYDEEGQVEGTRTATEGEHGTERWEIYDADGNLEWDMTWTYDPNGLILERREVDGEGDEIVYTHEYEFDDNGNWIRMVVTEEYKDIPATTYEIRDREITYH